MWVKYLSFAVVASALLVFVVGYKLTRHGYESPDYSVVRQQGAFEIRDYPSLPLATTSMNQNDSNDGAGFMRLFRYISGSNEGKRKLSMTVPVLMTLNDRDNQMSFILPAEIETTGAPASNSPAVELGTLSGGRFASYRFSGAWRMSRQREARETLLGWLRQESVEPLGQVMAASYDPPFTPAFMRRNEVLVRIPSASGALQHN